MQKVNASLQKTFEFPNGLSKGITCKTSFLKAVKIVQLRSGSLEMFWKETYGQEDFFASPFLKKKLEKQITKKEPFAKKAMKGISQARKDGLLELTPLMPQNRRLFYEDLYVE